MGITLDWWGLTSLMRPNVLRPLSNTDCQKVRNTTAFTAKSFNTTLYGANSLAIETYNCSKQYLQKISNQLLSNVLGRDSQEIRTWRWSQRSRQ